MPLADPLFPDMVPLSRQVRMTMDHAKGAPFRLAGLDVPVFADSEATLAELRVGCARVREVIAWIGDAAFAEAGGRTILIRTAGRALTFGVTDDLMGAGRPPTSSST